MAFLDNSGDIILDAVLTDEGRARLANGQGIERGMFRVVKFAFGDDEIDYNLYNPLSTSGSQYADLDILKTPIFEATTKSTAGLRSKLFSYIDQNLYYLPTLLLNQSTRVDPGPPSVLDTSTNSFNVISSDNLATLISPQIDSSNSSTFSLIDGRTNIRAVQSAFSPTVAMSANFSNFQSSELVRRILRVSQGFDNYQANISLGQLEETSFSVYVNKLFLKVVDKTMNETVQPSRTTEVFQRSQAMSVYDLDVTRDLSYFGDINTYNDGSVVSLATSLRASNLNQVGKELQFSLKLSSDLESNPSYYFSNYGTSFVGTMAGLTIAGGDSVSVINTTIRVVGNTYGFSVDIPIKLFYK